MNPFLELLFLVRNVARLLADWHTDLPPFQGARPDHVQVQSSSCWPLGSYEVLCALGRDWVLTNDMWHVLLQSENVFKLGGVTIGHVRYINILTWLRCFQVKHPYFVLFSLYLQEPMTPGSWYLSLFWELKNKRTVKKLQFWPESLRTMLEYWYIEHGLLFLLVFFQQCIANSFILLFNYFQF